VLLKPTVGTEISWTAIYLHSLTTRPIPVLEAPFMLSFCHVYLWIVILDTHAGDMSSVFLCGFGAFYKVELYRILRVLRAGLGGY
jgi:hypothetical protein